MKTINDGGPAFPRTGFELSRHDKSPADCDPQPGMTLRDYFAGQALAGVLSSGDVQIGNIITDKFAAAHLTQSCYIISDAMLAAREAKL